MLNNEKENMSEEKVTHRLTIPFEYNNKIIQKAGDARIYLDTILLTPGSWTDAMSMSPTEYTSEELERSAGKWESDYLNVDHSYTVCDRLGYVRNPHWYNESVMGDLHIYPITQTAKDTIALIDANLINSLSVELNSNDVWKSSEEKRYATDITFVGAAVCTFPACPDSKIR